MPYKDADKQREYQKLWSRRLPKATKQKNRQMFNDRRAGKRAIINEYKQMKGCFKCGIDNPVVLDFHHKDPSQKEINISRLVDGNWSLLRIQKEVDKCEVVCANCHRIIHHEMRSLV